MVSYYADSVVNEADTDYGEGWIGFYWIDPLCGREGISIELDGHCSRRMPIRSGQGPTVPGPGGTVMHSELSLGPGVIMVSSDEPDRGRVSPRTLPPVNQALARLGTT